MLEVVFGGGFLLLLVLLGVALMPGIDGWGGSNGSNNGAAAGAGQGGGGASGVVPGGGAAGGGGSGTPPPVVPPTPAPGPAPTPGGGQGVQGGQPAPAPGPQPVPGAQPGMTVPPGPGQGQGVQGVQGVQGGQPQPANPFAWLQALPAQTQAQVQAAFRAQREWEQNRHFARLGYEAYQRANGGPGGQQMPGQVTPGQPAAPAAKPNPFGVPAFDVRQMALIRRGENGQLEVDPYAPPGLLQQAQQYQDAVTKAQHEFFQDPRKALEGIVREIAGEVAQQTGQQQYQQVQEQQYAQQQLDPQGPNPWLYDRDAAGQVVYAWNPQQGRMAPQLSAWGQEYARVVIELQQNGVGAGPMQHRLAVQHLQNLAYGQVMQQRQAAAQGAAAGQNFLNGAANGQIPGQPSGPPTPAAPQPAPPPGAPAQRRSLRQELGDLWTQQGYTDDRLHAAVMNGVGSGVAGAA